MITKNYYSILLKTFALIIPLEMKPLSDIIQTYKEYKENGFLTQEQWDVVIMKYQGCFGQHIADRLNISKKIRHKMP